MLSTFNTYQQTLSVATSADGIAFHLLQKNGSQQLYIPAIGDVRDPSICLYRDAYYIAYTAGNFGNANYFSIIRSTDLISWTPVAQVDMSSISPGYVWAPELFVDDDGSVTALVSASSSGFFSLYFLEPTSLDLSTWSAPTPIGGAMTGRACIDAQVAKVAGTYYLSYRHYDNAGSGDFIEIATSSQRTSGYALTKTGNFAGWGGGGKEGPCLTFKGGTKWRMYLSDSTMTASPIRYSDSADNMGTWTPLLPIASDASAQPLAHGTVIRAPDAIQDIAIGFGPMSDDIRLSFSALPENSYTVQFRDSLTAGPWLKLKDVPQPLVPATAEVFDFHGALAPRRFYRVISPPQP